MFNGIEGITQVGFVVNDLDAAANRWFQRGAGPFRAFREIDVPLVYRGQPATFKLSLALGHCDGVQIELIQPLDNQASVFRDRFPDGWPEEGLHHLGMIASDYDRFVQAHVDQGRAVVMSGIFSGYRFCYIDTRDTLGFMLEAFEKTASLLSCFGEIRSMGEEWDGKSAYA